MLSDSHVCKCILSLAKIREHSTCSQGKNLMLILLLFFFFNNRPLQLVCFVFQIQVDTLIKGIVSVKSHFLFVFFTA